MKSIFGTDNNLNALKCILAVIPFNTLIELCIGNLWIDNNLQALGIFVSAIIHFQMDHPKFYFEISL